MKRFKIEEQANGRATVLVGTDGYANIVWIPLGTAYGDFSTVEGAKSYILGRIKEWDGRKVIASYEWPLDD